jgi:hypothetical protein
LDVRQVAAIAGGVGLLVTLTWGLFYAFFRGMAQTAVVDARAAADALEAAEG